MSIQRNVDENGGISTLFRRLGGNGKKTEKQKLIDEDKYPEQLAESYAHSNIDETVNWLHNRENREKLIESLHFVDKHLPKILLLLHYQDLSEDEKTPGNEKVSKFSSITIQKGERTWRFAEWRLWYLIHGQLSWFAKYLQSIQWPPVGRHQKYTIKMCYDDLAEYFRENYGRPSRTSWTKQKIATILFDKFGADVVGKKDLTQWIDTLMKRKTSTNR